MLVCAKAVIAGAHLWILVKMVLIVKVIYSFSVWLLSFLITRAARAESMTVLNHRHGEGIASLCDLILCMYVCMYVSHTCTYACTCTCTHTRKHTCTHACAHTHTHTRTHAHSHTHTHRCPTTHVYSDTHARAHSCWIAIRVFAGEKQTKPHNFCSFTAYSRWSCYPCYGRSPYGSRAPPAPGRQPGARQPPGQWHGLTRNHGVSGGHGGQHKHPLSPLLYSLCGQPWPFLFRTRVKGPF